MWDIFHDVLWESMQTIPLPAADFDGLAGRVTMEMNRRPPVPILKRWINPYWTRKPLALNYPFFTIPTFQDIPTHHQSLVVFKCIFPFIINCWWSIYFALPLTQLPAIQSLDPTPGGSNCPVLSIPRDSLVRIGVAISGASVSTETVEPQTVAVQQCKRPEFYCPHCFEDVNWCWRIGFQSWLELFMIIEVLKILQICPNMNLWNGWFLPRWITRNKLVIFPVEAVILGYPSSPYINTISIHFSQTSPSECITCHPHHRPLYLPCLCFSCLQT